MVGLTSVDWTLGPYGSFTCGLAAIAALVQWLAAARRCTAVERHCSHLLLPTKRAYDHLRPRGHSFELPSCTLELYKRSFIPRCLYKYI